MTSETMLLQRTKPESSGRNRSVDRHTQRSANSLKQPLTCMFYFFASQMKQNIQPADPDLVRRKRVADHPMHKLDTMLARIEMHAALSPLVSRIETHPVQIPEVSRLHEQNSKTSKANVHDTVLMLKFRDKNARQEWIATREWQDFMKNTDMDPSVFRRMPHVRCASSVKGLMDPIDVLTS